MRRAVLLLALGAGVLGAQPRPAPLTPSQRVAWAGLLRAADGRLATDTAAVDRALAAGDPALRRAAVRAIGQLRMVARYDTARAVVAAPDSGDAAEAAFALGLARDSLACAPLQGALRRGGGVGVEAVWSLGELGDRCLPVADMLAVAPDDATRVRVLEVAGRTRGVAVEPLLAAARNPSAGVRWGALYALARGRRREGVAAALGAVRDGDALVREQAARLLTRPLAGDSLAPPALIALGELLAAPEPHVRIAAVRSLATWGRPAQGPLLARLGVGGRADRDANVRVTVAEVLDTTILGTRDAWRRAWNADSTFMVRRALLGGALAGGIPLDGIEAWAHDPDWRRRAAVAQWAARGGERAVTTWAVTALRDPDGRVRTAAVGAVAARVDSSPPAGGPAWRALLADAVRGDADLYARAAALEALAPRATAADATLALDAYARAAVDTGNDARLGALRLLAAAWRRDSVNVTTSVIARLAALPAPDDLLLRAPVADVGPLAGWRQAPHPVPPLGHYLAVVRRYVEPARAGRPAEMTIATDRGDVRVRLACDDVPLTCAVFDSLAGARYWRASRFHRVVPAFVAQDGDPRGDGNGGPGFSIRDELTRRRYQRGAVGMALSGPDTGGSQYFLTLAPQPHLDGRYTVIGTVVAGWSAMDAIVQGDPVRELRVRR